MLVIFIRTMFLFLLVVTVLRLMGKRQIGELQPYDLVVMIMISDLATVPMADVELPILTGVIPILTLLFSQVFLAYTSLKSQKARNLINGHPVVLIEKSRILEPMLRSTRINLNDLLEQLRLKGYPDISVINYAILETNGQLSVIPNPREKPVTAGDIHLNPPDPGMPFSLILDGTVMTQNLSRLRLTEQSLTELLIKQGVQDPKTVFFAAMDETGSLFFQEKEGAS
ncbi:MAG: DUF421 domain-containing protein [Peptococcaceae bacterium]|jgi:uncharacterized membrane protein YcaP (DUF421 family)|nr:DUF421 domain-containing protein [Peptococcaceae bacterium]